MGIVSPPFLSYSHILVVNLLGTLKSHTNRKPFCPLVTFIKVYEAKGFHLVGVYNEQDLDRIKEMGV